MKGLLISFVNAGLTFFAYQYLTNTKKFLSNKIARIALLTLFVLFLSFQDLWVIIGYVLTGLIVFFYPQWRKIPYLKSILIGITWLIIGVWIPILACHNQFNVLILYQSVFLFVLIQLLMLSIDMRHRTSDETKRIITLAHHYTQNKGLFYLVFFLLILLEVLVYFLQPSFHHISALHFFLLIISLSMIQWQSKKTQTTTLQRDVFLIDTLLIVFGVSTLLIRIF